MLAISETWFNCSVSDLEIDIPGYNVFRVERHDKRGGGVCIYASHGFKTEVLHDISGISETSLHQLWIKTQVRHLKSFLVCTTYRLPNVPITCFNTDLSTSLVAALLYNKPVYILGDLNCNLLELNIPESQVHGLDAYNLLHYPFWSSTWSSFQTLQLSKTSQLGHASSCHM